MTNTADANYHRERSLARRVRLGRFFLVTHMVARIYSGYKLIQYSGRFFSARGQAERYARHHHRSAELIYRTALRLEGWLVKACQFIGSRADMLPPDADPAMVERFNEEISRALRKDPIIAAPGDLVLVGRVMGLLSGLGKQLGSEVNLLSTLLPYLVSQNANPDSVTPQEASRR